LRNSVVFQQAKEIGPFVQDSSAATAGRYLTIEPTISENVWCNSKQGCRFRFRVSDSLARSAASFIDDPQCLFDDGFDEWPQVGCFKHNLHGQFLRYTQCQSIMWVQAM